MSQIVHPGNHFINREHTHEQVIGIGIRTTNAEQLHQVVELTMDITTDRDGAFLLSSAQSSTYPNQSNTYHRLHIRLSL